MMAARTTNCTLRAKSVEMKVRAVRSVQVMVPTRRIWKIVGS
jgi:hypothetical protein